MHPYTVMCPMTPDLTSQLRWAPALPRVLWLQTSPLNWGGLRYYHVYYGSGPCFSTEVGSDAALCPMAPDLTSRLRWALEPPCVLWLWTSPPDWGGLWCCHVSCGSGSHLLTRAGSEAAMCPTAPCGPRVLSIKKSLAYMPMQQVTHVPNTRTCFWGASHQGHHAPARRAGRQYSQYLQGVRTYIYSAPTVRRQHCGPLVWHCYSAKWLDSTTLT
jgi:hypothetical protein